MSKIPKFVPRVWIWLIVSLFLVDSVTGFGGSCCAQHNCLHAHAHDACQPSRSDGAAPPACDHGSPSNGPTADGALCNCSILPMSPTCFSSPVFGALTSFIWMHGAVHALCLQNSAVNSGILAGGKRIPPLVSHLNPAIVSLQSVFLLM